MFVFFAHAYIIMPPHFIYIYFFMNKTLKCVISIYFIYSIKIKQKNILALIFYPHNTKLSIKQFKNLFRTFFWGGGHQPGNHVGTSLFVLNIPGIYHLVVSKSFQRTFSHPNPRSELNFYSYNPSPHHPNENKRGVVRG